LRPACLAAYMAESAAARRSVSWYDSPLARAVTLMETVTLSVGASGRSPVGIAREAT
jgi:hypothetical protein